MLCHVCYAEPDAQPDCAACRGTGRATSVPLCTDPWNEVVPNLWMGGHDVRSQSPTACLVTDQFDVVVSMTTRDGYGPDDGVEHHVARMADAGVDAGIAARIAELAGVVAEAAAAGRKVLVRCSGGLNRSGLVVASALVRMGHAPQDAIALVRAARGPWALTNPAFVGHVRSLEPDLGT